MAQAQNFTSEEEKDNQVRMARGIGRTIRVQPLGLIKPSEISFNDADSYSDWLRPFVESISETSEEEDAEKVQEPVAPPKSWMFLLEFTALAKDKRENLRGDIDEMYQEIYKEFGARRAGIWVRFRVIKELWPVISAMKSLVAKPAVFAFISTAIPLFLYAIRFIITGTRQ